MLIPAGSKYKIADVEDKFFAETQLTILLFILFRYMLMTAFCSSVAFVVKV